MSGVSGYALGRALTTTLEQAPVILGPVMFAGHEVPSRISIGGAHAVTIHRLPGGGRVIDAMGMDDGAVKWSGYFTGPIATARARVIDSIRRAGEPVELIFGDYTFTVIVVHFEYDLQDRGAVISYRIRTEIIPDNEPTADVTSGTALASLSNDIVAATTILSGSAPNNLQEVLGAVIASTTIPGDPAASSKLTAIASSLQIASNLLQIEAVRNAARLSFAARAGDSEMVSASTLAAAVQTSEALALATRAAGYVNRSSIWLSQISGQARSILPIYA